MARKAKAVIIVEKKKCAKCKLDKNLVEDFYMADADLFPDGRIHLCKSCVEEYIVRKGFVGLLDILRILDKPFLQDKYKDDYKRYLILIQSLRQYKTMKYSNSIFDNKANDLKVVKSVEVEEENNLDESDIMITQKMRIFWSGQEDNDILALEAYFTKLVGSYGSDTPIQISIYRNMAITQLKADKATSTADFDKLMGTLSKLMTDANIKPVQETGANDNSISTWGEWIRKIEEDEPIGEPTEEFKDPDGIVKYVQTWFVSHFSRIFGLMSDEDNENIARDRGTDDGFSELSDGEEIG